jgi:hypothetical protein
MLPANTSATEEEIAMIGKKAFVAFAVATALGILGAVSAAASDCADRGKDKGGSVMPCSLDGVNPAHNPEIFGNAATAATYGFVQSANHTWSVRPGCRR